MIRAAVQHEIGTVNSSSMGRLFDTVSALLGIREENGYEGECAIALENEAYRAADNHEEAAKLTIPVSRDREGMLIADRYSLLRQMLEQSGTGQTKEALALGFHEAAAEMILQMCLQIRKESNENTVALSGGVFANQLLLERTREKLEENSFLVYYNERVPSNDGGIALGQAWIAAQMDRSAGSEKLTVKKNL